MRHPSVGTGSWAQSPAQTVKNGPFESVEGNGTTVAFVASGDDSVERRHGRPRHCTDGPFYSPRTNSCVSRLGGKQGAS